MGIVEIENAVSKLPPKDLAKFRSWFEEFDIAAWDKQLEEDIVSGKLDAIADKAIRDFKDGNFKKL